MSVLRRASTAWMHVQLAQGNWLRGQLLGVIQVGVFKAGFLVVTSLEHPYNNLGDLQRAKWSPTAASLLGTLDIGCALLHVACIHV